jgi:hemerythrin superfamily protein
MFEKIDKLKEDAREALTGRTPENDLRACLHQDHSEVAKLIDEMQSTGDEEVPIREDIRDDIVVKLTAHARAEEEVVYEYLMRWAQTQGETDHAFDEHDEIDRVLDVLRSMDCSDPALMDVVRDLKDAVTRHVHDEENKLLPKAEKEIGREELAKLIQPFVARKQEMIPDIVRDQEVWSAPTPVVGGMSNPLSESDSRF